MLTHSVICGHSIIMKCFNLGDELRKGVESSLVKKLQLPAFSASIEKQGWGLCQIRRKKHSNLSHRQMN